MEGTRLSGPLKQQVEHTSNGAVRGGRVVMTGAA